MKNEIHLGLSVLDLVLLILVLVSLHPNANKPFTAQQRTDAAQDNGEILCQPTLDGTDVCETGYPARPVIFTSPIAKARWCETDGPGHFTGCFETPVRCSDMTVVSSDGSTWVCADLTRTEDK